MFKAVNVTRPWPTTNMTSELWLDVPTQWVYYDDLVMTQHGVYFGAILDEVTPPVGGDPHPHVILWAGQKWLEDGHTRVIRRMLKNHVGGLVRVLDLDA